MKKSILFFCLLSSFFSLAQETISIDGQDCGLHGSARYNSRAWNLDVYKNRYNFPVAADFDTSLSIQSLASSADPNAFSQDKAVILRGFVYNVKTGGVETCNCKTTDPQFRDTHIELVPDEDHTDARYRVIVEVTPRLRLYMAGRGEDWSTPALRQKFKGQKVEVSGWLFYDAEHETGAFANDPDDEIGQKNWRASCWEVHPVTYLKIISGGTSSFSKSISEQQRPNPPASTKRKSNYTWLVVVAALLILILFFRRRRRR